MRYFPTDLPNVVFFSAVAPAQQVDENVQEAVRYPSKPYRCNVFGIIAHMHSVTATTYFSIFAIISSMATFDC